MEAHSGVSSCSGAGGRGLNGLATGDDIEGIAGTERVDGTQLEPIHQCTQQTLRHARRSGDLSADHKAMTLVVVGQSAISANIEIVQRTAKKSVACVIDR